MYLSNLKWALAALQLLCITSSILSMVHLNDGNWTNKSFAEEAIKQQAFCNLSNTASLNLCVFKTIELMKTATTNIIEKDDEKELNVTKNRVQLKTTQFYDYVDQANLMKSSILTITSSSSNFTFLLCTSFVYSKYINAFDYYIQRFEASCTTCVSTDKSNRTLIQNMYDFFFTLLSDFDQTTFKDNINVGIDQLDSDAKPNFLKVLTFIKDLVDLDSVKLSTANQDACYNYAKIYAGEGNKINFDSWDRDNIEEMKVFVFTDKLVYP